MSAPRFVCRIRPWIRHHDCKTVHLYVTASLIKLRYFKENLTDRHRDCALKYSKCSSSSPT